MNAASVLLAVTVVGAPLLFGATRAWAIAPLFLAALAAFWASGRERRGVRIDGVVVAGLVMLAATVLQAVPLPEAVVHVLSPTAWEIERGALGPLATGTPGWMTISLAPAATWIEAAKVALLVLVYCAARDVAARASRPIVSEMIALAGLLAVGVAVAHAVAGAEAVYGWYRPAGVEYVVAPFVNGNHQAGLLTLAIAAAVGLTLGADGSRRRLFWGGVVVAVLLGAVLTRSRAGMLAVVLASLGAVGLRFAGRSRAARWLPAAFAAAILAVAVLRIDAVLDVFSDTNIKKIEMWKPVPEYLRDFWATGSGRGAFIVTYKRYQELPDDRTYTHAENVPLQMLLDHGVLLGGLLVVVAGSALCWVLVRRHNSSHEAAATAGLTALALHNLLDFNLEVAGVAVPAVALLAAFVASRGAKRRQRRVPRAMLAGVAVVVVGVGLWLGMRNGIGPTEARVRAAADRGAGFHAALIPALNNHPADHMLPLLAAGHEVRQARRGKAAAPLPWVNRALELFPRSYDAHLLAARWLAWAGHHRQAILEYRLAIDARPAQTDRLLHDMARRWPDFERLRDVARDREARLARWDLLATILDREETRVEAERADLALLGVDPSHRQALSRRAWRALEQGRLETALQRADALRAVDPGRGWHVRGRVHLRQDRPREAARALERATKADPHEAGAWLDLARAAFANDDADRGLAAVERARLAASGEAGAVGVEIRGGAILENAGQEAAAIRAYQRATTIDRTNLPAWRRLLRLAERHGRRDIAARARRALREQGSGSGTD